MFSLRRMRHEPVLSVRSVARTHIGKVRSVNEDRLLDCADRRLWAVADGMGGHHLGDAAATIVVKALAQIAQADTPLNHAAIVAALHSANRDILALSKAAGHICGSTVAALHMHGGAGTLYWAGDSRVYRMRAGRLERLSHDHSVVQELADAGLITEAQGRYHPQSNVITRAIGIADHPDIAHAACTVQAGDLYLLCSDGLSAGLADDMLAAMLSPDIDDTASRLLRAALDAGGSDNISFVVISVTSV